MPKTQASRHTATEGKIEYEDYVRERNSLANFAQASCDGYERTILTLSAAFLAFSVSFLGLLRKEGANASSPPTIISPGLLFSSWVFFAVSVFIMLGNFMVNVKGLWAANEDVWNSYSGQATHGAKKWTRLGYSLYFAAGISFVLGVIELIRFCAANLWMV